MSTATPHSPAAPSPSSPAQTTSGPVARCRHRDDLKLCCVTGAHPAQLEEAAVAPVLRPTTAIKRRLSATRPSPSSSLFVCFLFSWTLPCSWLNSSSRASLAPSLVSTERGRAETAVTLLPPLPTCADPLPFLSRFVAYRERSQCCQRRQRRVDRRPGRERRREVVSSSPLRTAAPLQLSYSILGADVAVAVSLLV